MTPELRKQMREAAEKAKIDQLLLYEPIQILALLDALDEAERKIERLLDDHS